MGRELARPTVLTDEAKALIVDMVSWGSYLKVACDAAGFSYRTLRYWQKAWEDGEPNAQAHDDFFQSLKKAIAIGEGRAILKIQRGEPGWQGSAWFLERRFPQRWAKKERPTEAPPQSGVTVTIRNGSKPKAKPPTDGPADE